MGHTRLGLIPKSNKWEVVVSHFVKPDDNQLHISDQSEISRIAGLTIDAAQGGIQKAIRDDQLTDIFFLLTKVVLASKTNEWDIALKDVGINLPENATIFDLVGEMQFLLDERFHMTGQTSDLSEIGQKALGETLFTLISGETFDLFDDDKGNLQGVLKGYCTKNGFGTITQTFFGKFLTRYLNFYLSRLTAKASGSRFVSDTTDISEFNALLAQHCFQSSRIVNEFGGTWVMKNAFKEDLTPEKVKGFIAVALKKLSSELQLQVP
jgi:hypothetical protein